MRIALRLFTVFSGVLVALPASAIDMPKRKPGLWELKATAPGDPPTVMQQCIDEAYDARMHQLGAAQSKEMCSKNDTRREGGKIIADGVCKIGSSTVTTHSVTTGDFSSAYRVEVKSSYNPPLMGVKDGETLLEARWLGACLPGQKPGAMVMPGRAKSK